MINAADSGIAQGNGRAPEESAKLVGGGMNPFAAEALHLREIFGILRRRYVVIVLVMAGVVGGAAVWLWARPRLYQATVALLIVDAQRSLAGPILNEQTGRGVGRLTDPIRSHIQVLQGRTVLGKVVDREGLRLVPSSSDFPRHLLSAVSVGEPTIIDFIELKFTPQYLTARARGSEVRGGYGQRIQIAGISFTVDTAPQVAAITLRVMDRDYAIDRLAERLRVLPRTGTDVIEISYTSTDPLAAQRVVNTIAEVFQLHNLQMVQHQTTRRRLFLENQLRSTESQLIAANEALNNFRQSRQAYRPAEQLSAHQQALMTLDIQRSEIEADRGMYRSLLEALRTSADGQRGKAIRTLVSSPDIASNPVVSQLYAQLVEHEATRDELTTGPSGSTAANPDVERLNRLIATVEAKLIDASESHVTALGARLAALDSLRTRDIAEMQGLPGAETEEARLQRDIHTIGNLAELIRADLQRSRMAEAIETGQVDILDRAAPAQPLRAGRRKRLVLATILGLMFGGGAAFALEFMDGTMRRRREVEGILHLPCLAVIPPIQEPNDVHSRLRLLKRFTPGNGRKQRNVPPVTVSRGPGVAAGVEAFRRLRNNLFQPVMGTRQILMVASPSPGEGKTVIAANLAVTLAKQGKHVLVMDTDLQRPALHEVFQLELQPGVAEVLRGQQSLSDAITKTSIDHLFVLTAGDPFTSAYDLFQREALSDILSSLAGMFDVVILDTAPILAAADAVTLAAMSDGVLLVLRAGATQPDVAQRAVEELSRVGAHIVGAVLADPDRKVLEDASYENYTTV